MSARDRVTGELRTQILDEDDWYRLRDVRLTALRECPGAFLSSYECELAYGEAEWRGELSRGEWTIVVGQGRTVGLLGVTQEVRTPPTECYLEYLWVSPCFRRLGVATILMKAVLRNLLHSGIATVWLWILNGNEPARRLYEQFGFVGTNVRQSLSNSPSRSEELMKLALR
jgi:ribosomal protein S18 acetylase RimI-like enzyme